LGHDKGRPGAGRFDIERAARGQTGAAIVAPFHVEQGESHETPFLPPDISAVACPKDPDQKEKSDQAADQDFDKEALPSVVRKFNLRSFRFQNWIQRLELAITRTKSVPI
jgi:hypothetical protein